MSGQGWRPISHVPTLASKLANMSQRMAAQLREDITDRGSVKPREAEEAMATIVAAIRDMEAAGELKLVAVED